MNTRRDPIGDLGFDWIVLLIGLSITSVGLLTRQWTGDGELFPVLVRMGGWTDLGGWREPWRLASYSWVHGSLEHGIGNLLALAVFGWPLERAIGWRRFLLLWLGGAVAGSVAAAVLTHPHLMVGASGALFAVWGAMAGLAARPGRVLHGEEVAAIREAIWPLGVQMALTSLMPGVAWAAHLGGAALGLALAVTGALVAGAEPRAEADEPIPRVNWARAVFGTLGVGILACGCPNVSTAILVVWVIVMIAVARATPRYRALEGVPVTVAAIGAGIALWGSLAVAFAAGAPWAAGEPELRWVAPGPGLPEILAPTDAGVPDGEWTRFGDPGTTGVQVSVRSVLTAEPIADRAAALLAAAEPRETGNGPDCPWIALEDRIAVLLPDRTVELAGASHRGAVRVGFRSSGACAALPSEERARIADAMGEPTLALLLRAEARPDDVALQIAASSVRKRCDERIPWILEHLAPGDRAQLLAAAEAGSDCRDGAVDAWLDALIAGGDPTGRASALRAERRWEAGDRSGALADQGRAAAAGWPGAPERLAFMRGAMTGADLPPP